MNHSIQLPDKEYPEYVAELRAVAPSIAEAIGEFTGIGQVLNWMQQTGLDLRSIDTVSQDEFSYDFLLPLSDGRWLAFGVT
jgi:hypothetical protein